MSEAVFGCYQRMSGQFAAWALRASPKVWNTTNRLTNVFHYVNLGCLELNEAHPYLARPTPLGVRAARFYCEQTGLTP